MKRVELSTGTCNLNGSDDNMLFNIEIMYMIFDNLYDYITIMNFLSTCHTYWILTYDYEYMDKVFYSAYIRNRLQFQDTRHGKFIINEKIIRIAHYVNKVYGLMISILDNLDVVSSTTTSSLLFYPNIDALEPTLANLTDYDIFHSVNPVSDDQDTKVIIIYEASQRLALRHGWIITFKRGSTLKKSTITRLSTVPQVWNHYLSSDWDCPFAITTITENLYKKYFKYEKSNVHEDSSNRKVKYPSRTILTTLPQTKSSKTTGKATNIIKPSRRNKLRRNEKWIFENEKNIYVKSTESCGTSHNNCICQDDLFKGTKTCLKCKTVYKRCHNFGFSDVCNEYFTHKNKHHRFYNICEKCQDLMDSMNELDLTNQSIRIEVTGNNRYKLIMS